MKTNKRQARLVLKLNSFGTFIEEACELETMLAKKPARLTIEMMGMGEFPADSALLIRSMLLARSRKTRVITHARSSLQGPAVLVWLLGDTRLIRDDAKLFFRSAGEFESSPEEKAAWKDRDLCEDNNLEETDYIRVLQAINEFLPVREFADWPIELPALRQFGLVENQAVDRFLSNVFRKEKRKKIRSPTEPDSRSVKQDFSI